MGKGSREKKVKMNGGELEPDLDSRFERGTEVSE